MNQHSVTSGLNSHNPHLVYSTCLESTRSDPQSGTKNRRRPERTPWLLTQLLQQVIHEVEEAGNGVLGLPGIDLGFLSSLRGLDGGTTDDAHGPDGMFASS